ncbi:MAG: hypothetical protein BGO51_02090 [Rhodospirillales bacterium 69-11]|nr:hypothetical protein [Rhodospirillales bacterium]MBN8907680.1 hypothetical protein [Rhodospirillales bacterium]MBN8928827.1 hypothetical protein [Rhodospirillales bacterium]OJW25389.1 MAG: hypothetical protein BGO51_02090 [Rhodospirillales bacterium 69-11]
MALSMSERTDIRRFCGYPVVGEAPDGSRLFPANMRLEVRMESLSSSEELLVRRQLATLSTLEADVTNAGGNLDTDQAGIWSRNRTEVQDRERLFGICRRRLCHFLGIAPGPGLQARSDHAIIV